MQAKSLQSCPALCNPLDCRSPGPIHGFSRQEYWSGLLCPPPGDLPDPEIKPISLVSPALAGRFFFFFLTASATWEAPKAHKNYYISTYTVLSFSLYIQWLTYNIEKCSPSELVNENIFFVLIENYISKKKLCSSWQHGS